LIHDLSNVTVIVAFSHGVSPHEVEGIDESVDSPWFLQLCIHALEHGLMLETKGNSRNVKFALGNLHLM
jgi:hypothetical protein